MLLLVYRTSSVFVSYLLIRSVVPDIYLLKPFLFLGGFSHPLSLKPIPSENGVLVNGALVFEAFQYCFLTRRWFVHCGEHVKHLFSLVLVSKGNGCFMHLPVVWGGGRNAHA